MRIAVSRKWCIFFGKKLIQFSRNLAKMIWWHSKQREKWESQNKLFSCVSALVLTITSATQKKLFCHQWILTRFRDEKLTSFQKIATKHSAAKLFRERLRDTYLLTKLLNSSLRRHVQPTTGRWWVEMTSQCSLVSNHAPLIPPFCTSSY